MLEVELSKKKDENGVNGQNTVPIRLPATVVPSDLVTRTWRDKGSKFQDSSNG
jgi:hypothetical protein